MIGSAGFDVTLDEAQLFRKAYLHNQFILKLEVVRDQTIANLRDPIDRARIGCIWARINDEVTRQEWNV